MPDTHHDSSGRRRLRGLWLAAALAASGCSYDFSNYDFAASEDAGPGGGNAGDGDGTVDAGRAALFSNACNLDSQQLTASAEDFAIDTMDFDNDWEVARCTADPAAGRDGFFAVELAKGEKWHFHLKSNRDDVDPVLYIVDACDERRCLKAQTSNNCTSKVEHMSFVAPSTGTYLVGIDTVGSSDGAELSFLAVRPECGNGGNPEHSEGCEDGNRVDGDGCDHLCRTEVGPGDGEGEPNDDFTSANVVFFQDDESLIRGAISSACDLEKFAIEIPQDGMGLSAELLVGPNGNACQQDDEPGNLKLELYRGETLVGAGEPTDGNACPVIDERLDFASDLRRGTYHLNLANIGAADEFPYVLKLTLR